MTNETLTQAYLKEHLDYCPATGILRWVKPTGFRAKAGDEAGSYSRGYRSIGIGGQNHFAHRLIWVWMTGEWPKGEVDHKNHIRNDNRWENLRDVIHMDNGRNHTMKKNNISGFTGVFWSKKNKNWTAQISVGGKGMHLGCFAKIEDAVEARRQASLKYGFHENHGVEKVGSLQEA